MHTHMLCLSILYENDNKIFDIKYIFDSSKNILYVSINLYSSVLDILDDITE